MLQSFSSFLLFSLPISQSTRSEVCFPLPFGGTTNSNTTPVPVATLKFVPYLSLHLATDGTVVAFVRKMAPIRQHSSFLEDQSVEISSLFTRNTINPLSSGLVVYTTFTFLFLFKIKTNCQIQSNLHIRSRTAQGYNNEWEDSVYEF